MKTVLGVVVGIILAIVFTICYTSYCEKVAMAEFKELSNNANKDITKVCNEVGGTLAKGVEVTYTGVNTEITLGVYCINTKNPTGSIR